MNEPRPSAGAVLHISGERADIRLDRVAKRNAITADLVDALEQALTDATRAGCTVAVLGANGPVFCAGGDLDDQRAGRTVPAERIIAPLNETPLFVIAKVQGDVYGGGLALLGPCPVVMCVVTARLVLPAARSVDVFPEGFLPYLGPDLAPRHMLELALRSGPCSAARAASMGWITAVSDAAAIDAEVDRWVDDAVGRPDATRTARSFWRRRYEAGLNQHGRDDVRG